MKRIAGLWRENNRECYRSSGRFLYCFINLIVVDAHALFLRAFLFVNNFMYIDKW